ncbi:MAG: hypothetical protein M1818_007928 [Claussenomyces sp. TS43310]|nr:MAG: hypothetical protein M1818_007928 [Claussenomyces sp. TS43310]
MSLLSSHLDQIALSSESIGTLPFPPPKVFTNALLASHDITSLIRDTEAHERALFSVPPPPPAPTSQNHPDPNSSTSGRRRTVFNVAGGEVTSSAATAPRAPRRNTAVAAVLGPELNSAIKSSENQTRGEIDVEVLLRGAEKLGEVYTMDGAKDRIAALRLRYARLRGSLAHYEAKVARQTSELERMNRPSDWEGGSDDEAEEKGGQEADREQGQEKYITEEHLRAEEEEIKDLEMRKRELEDRVIGMERDLGGLLRG